MLNCIMCVILTMLHGHIHLSLDIVLAAVGAHLTLVSHVGAPSS